MVFFLVNCGVIFPEGAAKLWFGVWEGSETVLHRWELVTRVALILLRCCNKPGSRERRRRGAVFQDGHEREHTAIRGAELRKLELHHPSSQASHLPGLNPPVEETVTMGPGENAPKVTLLCWTPHIPIRISVILFALSSLTH